ncbi:TIGR04211 family SH3 domain-containing protein [Alteromonas sp. a30]|uniref:TIGR04211 family SH3 domain-containing protein n=1 Tax=Alteromonas sp. a30 TaxID=2730917 RepID=UPI002280B702|nr:TIGR04211 family SH3 domain-containing protein [Alteromonas sp. a30]MCY7294277.1 TIGR04211 family SH3 domain-containing protein [Alteromonas sp. a30]
MVAQINRLFLVFLLIFSAHVVAQSNDSSGNELVDGEPRFISDDLYIYLHSGPGRNYRILGSVSAGTPITQLQTDAETQYVEIIDDKDRRGWVEGRHVSETPSLRDQIPQLKEEMAGFRETLMNKETRITQLSKYIEKLESEKVSLQTQYDQLLKEHEQSQQRISQESYASQKEWFVRGGLLALGGVIIGIVITYLPKKRQRRDTWM